MCSLYFLCAISARNVSHLHIFHLLCCSRHPLVFVAGSMRLATAATCLDTALELRASLAEIEAPFLCLAAGDVSAENLP